MHYGGYGPDEREYDAIEVWGVTATSEVQAAVTELGYGRIEPRPGGFRAARSAPAA
jgi:hypothetical protein